MYINVESLCSIPETNIVYQLCHNIKKETVGSIWQSIIINRWASHQFSEINESRESLDIWVFAAVKRLTAFKSQAVKMGFVKTLSNKISVKLSHGKDQIWGCGQIASGLPFSWEKFKTYVSKNTLGVVTGTCNWLKAKKKKSWISLF